MSSIPELIYNLSFYYPHKVVFKTMCLKKMYKKIYEFKLKHTDCELEINKNYTILTYNERIVYRKHNDIDDISTWKL